MNWGTIVPTLVGALIAYVAATAHQRRQIQADRETARQQRILDVVADFWGASTDVWHDSQENALEQMGHMPEHARDPSIADRAAQRELAKLRILAPRLEETARMMLAASGPYPPDHMEEADRDHLAATEAFETAVRDLLDIEVPDGVEFPDPTRGGK